MASNSTIELNQLVLLPGQSVLLQNISWSKFEEIISELGSHRASIIAYDQGMLEIMVPLPEHEYFKDAIGDLLKDLALELAIEYECFSVKHSKLWLRDKEDRGDSPKSARQINSSKTCEVLVRFLPIAAIRPNTSLKFPSLRELYEVKQL